MWLLRRALQRAAGFRYRALAPAWFVSVLYKIVAAMSTLIAIWENGDRVADHLKASLTVSKEFETYDFIIIGAGSAGSVVANRLSENPDWKVLLIEAGGEPHPLQAIPTMAFTILNYPEIDWMHKTVPQTKSCFGLVNQESGWSQGKALGGTSNINFLLHFRGNPKDFDNWAAITGDPSWNYEETLKYFRKSENFDGDWLVNDHLHGFDGPLKVQRPDYVAFAEEYVKAGMDMGYSQVDLNGNYTEGFDTAYYAIKNGRRDAVYRSYIQPIRRIRPNLTIYKYAHVNKIIFREGTNEAYGVQYDRHGEKRYAYARKEIILSAGAVQSPKLLMLSGIGRKEHLEELKIPVISDLPVGKNLQDHISTYLGPFEMSSDQIHSPRFDRDITPRSFYEYSVRGQGILTTSGVQASGIFSSSYAKANGEPDWPDLQLFLIGISVHDEWAKQLSRAFHLKEAEFVRYYRDSIGKNSFHQIVSLARPKSRGEILLDKNDPYVEPIIDPKYFEDEDDMKVFLEGVKKALFLAENTTTFSSVGTKFTDSVLPGCEDVPFRSDEYFECYIRTYSVTLHHIVGTCAMGKNNSRNAVVDPELRVIGVKGLRVIDASVIPIVPVSNTQAPTIMIGEKGADLIKNAWVEFESTSTTTTETPVTEETSTLKPAVVEPVDIRLQLNKTKVTTTEDAKVISASNSVLTDCDYCELDGRKEELNLQFAL